MFRLIRRWRKNEKGQALVELAVVLPVLLLLMFGIIEFGRIYGAYLNISSAAREAVRAGVVGATDSQMEAVVHSATAGLDGDSLTVNITPDETLRKRGEQLKVHLGYNVKIYAPIISGIIGDPFPLAAETTMRVE